MIYKIRYVYSLVDNYVSGDEVFFLDIRRVLPQQKSLLVSMSRLEY